MTFPPGETPLVVITVRCTTPEALKLALADGGELCGDLLNEPGIDDARIRKVIDTPRSARPRPPAAPATAIPCPSPSCPARPRKDS